MNWFDKLKKLIHIEINSPIININIIKDSDNSTIGKYDYDETKEKLNLYLDKLDDKTKEQLNPIFQEYLGEGNKLLENETSELLYSLYRYNKETKNRPILNFFKPIIPIEDFRALEASLYLRESFIKKEDIRKLKRDIKDRFGNRGNNISNLCTAGYFEEFLMPLHNYSRDQFTKLYELIVLNAVLAIFVHKQMPLEEITSQIKKKLEISKRYGIKFIHIHGIGKSNIAKIKNCIAYEKKFFDFFEKNNYEKEDIIIVELLLK
ncbi:MAG: hypothetical protein KAT28_03090 [Candidatus Aenigmarchaeota archaeon]|nr:hypothetical protein [Candidatus Aenigmarchaeota archaeon]